MPYHIIDAESEKWSSFLSIFSSQDIFASSRYLQLFEAENLKPTAFVFQDSSETLFYSFLLGKIESSAFYDIQPPFGYSSILSTSCNPIFLNSASESFCCFCNSQNIVAELVRFNPLRKAHEILPHLEIMNLLDNVSVDLTKSAEIIWKTDFNKSLRKQSIQKAKKNKLKFGYCSGLDAKEQLLSEVWSVYLSTMDRNKASNAYYFNDSFLQNLTRKMTENLLLVFVRSQTKIVSMEVILLDGDTAYAFLGGTEKSFFHLNPNSFLKFELFKLLITKGVKTYSMGGGKVRNDSLFKYKKRFAPNTPNEAIFLGSKVHNHLVYKKLVANWEKSNSDIVKQFESYVLKYRIFK